MTLNLAEDSSVWIFDILPQEAEELLDSISSEIIIEDLSFEDLEWFHLITPNWDEIARIYNWVFYWVDGEKPHIWLEVHRDWRRLWIATKLYQLWDILGYEVLEEEYTRKVEKINFLESIWYQVMRILDNQGNECEELEDWTYAELIKI